MDKSITNAKYVNKGKNINEKLSNWSKCDLKQMFNYSVFQFFISLNLDINWKLFDGFYLPSFTEVFLFFFP